ncbi:MAG: hypothetical protein R3322_00190 [Kiloniellales bacterium]|nr:hypothetical protein [Kiloniellales bacterium]
MRRPERHPQQLATLRMRLSELEEGAIIAAEKGDALRVLRLHAEWQRLTGAMWRKWESQARFAAPDDRQMPLF